MVNVDRIGLKIYDVNNKEIYNGDTIYSKEMVSSADKREGQRRLFTVYYSNGTFRLKNDVHDISIEKFKENFSMEIVDK